jgi:hypothetical protein
MFYQQQQTPSDSSSRSDSEYPIDSLTPTSARLKLNEEKHIYQLAHIKLSQVSRPLRHQVLISNFMMYILSVHSDVTIRGRGPRRGKKHIRKLLIDFEVDKPVDNSKIQKHDSSDEESSSGSDDDEELPLSVIAKQLAEGIDEWNRT